MKKLHLFKLLLVTFVLSLPFTFFGQSVLYVTSLGDNGPGTLRQQVINAFPGDTIKFQVTGTIFLSTGWIDFAKNLVIEGPGMNDLIIRPTSQDRVIRFNGNFSLSKLTIKDGFSSNSSWSGGITGSGGIVKLDRVKFDNCKKQVSGAASFGGAASINADSVFITNSIFLNNRATSSNKNGGGGAVVCSGLKVFVKNCTFEGNASSAGCDYSNGVLDSRGFGGAIQIGGANTTSTILVDSCMFNNNHIASYCTINAGSSIGRGYAYGGAIHLSSIRNSHTIKISNSTFTSNSATGSGASTYDYSYGGAISNDESISITTSTIQLENLIIDGNTANGTGEGIVFIKGGGLKMSNCKVVNNTAVVGAVNVLTDKLVEIAFCNFSDNNGIGINSFVYSPSSQSFSNCLFEGNSNSAIKLVSVSGTTNIVNSTFTGNRSNGGSSIYLSSNNGPINILNCTMMDEQVLTAGKPHSLYVSNSSNVAIKNTIISNSTFSSNPLVAYSGSTILTGGGNIIRDGSLATFLVNATDMNNTNPLLGTFADHGGPTYTYSLQPTSPAIDLGGLGTLPIDQRGFYRTNAIDAGAFEFNGVDPYEPFVLDMSADAVTMCANDMEQIWVSSNDVPNDPVQFQWMLNGVDITGATDTFYQVENLTPGIYYYSCELSNNSSSVISDTITVEVLAGPGVTTNGSTSICSGESVTISASGATNYSWDNGLGAGASHTVSPSVTTTYQVTGTGSNGCTKTDQVTVTVNNNPIISAGSDATICAGESVTISGSGATSYVWNNGLGAGTSHTVSPSVTTTYQVTGTGSNGCTNTDQVTVTVTSNPTIIASNDVSICAGENVTVSASGATSYVWNNGLGAGVSHVVSPSVTTTYQVTGTGSNGCTNTDQVIVTVNSNPTISAGNDATICAGESVMISGSGATSYVWDNGLGAGASHTVSPSVTTTYQVIGTGSNGCTNTDQITVTVNSNSTIIASNDASICAGESATISASGATSYFWNNGLGAGASHVVSPSVTTTYQVIGTDNNGCTGTDQVIITVTSNPTIIASNDASICAGESITVSAFGATNYVWNNGLGAGVSHVVSPSVTTTYEVTGTNNNGCTGTDQVTITVISNPTIIASNDASICAGESITVSASGAINYVWNNGLGAGISHVVSPSVTTTYQVTGTDANGCTNTDQVIVGVTATPDNNVTLSSDQLTIIATSTGVDYTWIDCNNSFQVISNETNQSFTPSQNGSYAVIVSNQGCADTSLCMVIDHLSLNSLQENQSIAIYPNPFDTEFIISFKTAGSHFIELLNTLGQTIKTIWTEEQSTVVSVDDLSSGVYYIRVVGTSWSYKIIKN